MIRSVRVAKRLVDVALSSVGLMATLPLYPAIVAAVAVESRGPVFFRQKRAGRLIEGQNGRALKFEEFHIVKFRTMRADAEKHTGAVVASVNDNRITKVGAFLRKTRLDEIPQFWNVLKGDMSIVGPRPERPELLRDLSLAIPYFEERMREVKPGITGMAQIYLDYTGRPRPGMAVAKMADTLTNPYQLDGTEGALADDMRVKLLYDLAYCATLENLGTYLRTELSILVKTPLVMVKAAGR